MVLYCTSVCHILHSLEKKRIKKNRDVTEKKDTTVPV